VIWPHEQPASVRPWRDEGSVPVSSGRSSTAADNINGSNRSGHVVGDLLPTGTAAAASAAAAAGHSAAGSGGRGTTASCTVIRLSHRHGLSHQPLLLLPLWIHRVHTSQYVRFKFRVQYGAETLKPLYTLAASNLVRSKENHLRYPSGI